MTPEQAAIWSYPLRDGTEEEVIFNMVNALLLRIHQSGHLAEISPERFDLVKEGIDCYKEIRSGIKDGVPFWPMGWADNEDKHLAAGHSQGKSWRFPAFTRKHAVMCSITMTTARRCRFTSRRRIWRVCFRLK